MTRRELNVLHAFRALDGQGSLVALDKLALVANVCNWQKTIDLSTLDTTKIGYYVCLWALAIINGDASFFCQDKDCVPGPNASRMLWVPHVATNLRKMICTGWINSVPMEISEQGLRTSGWLFRMTRWIDLGSTRIGNPHTRRR